MDIPPPDAKQKTPEHGMGPLLGIVIIVLLLLAGGIYFLVTKAATLHQPPAGQEQVNS